MWPYREIGKFCQGNEGKHGSPAGCLPGGPCCEERAVGSGLEGATAWRKPGSDGWEIWRGGGSGNVVSGWPLLSLGLASKSGSKLKAWASAVCEDVSQTAPTRPPELAVAAVLSRRDPTRLPSTRSAARRVVVGISQRFLFLFLFYFILFSPSSVTQQLTWSRSDASSPTLDQRSRAAHDGTTRSGK